jgi:hypothetical protein
VAMSRGTWEHAPPHWHVELVGQSESIMHGISHRWKTVQARPETTTHMQLSDPHE